jgi:hypothetical protein
MRDEDTTTGFTSSLWPMQPHEEQDQSLITSDHEAIPSIETDSFEVSEGEMVCMVSEEEMVDIRYGESSDSDVESAIMEDVSRNCTCSAEPSDAERMPPPPTSRILWPSVPGDSEPIPHIRVHQGLCICLWSLVHSDESYPPAVFKSLRGFEAAHRHE